jgi:hypothetical protein
MKTQIIRLTMACVLSLVFVGCASTGHQHVVWEYKILQVVQRRDVSDVEKPLNDLARQGWVLVSDSTTGEGHQVHTCVLKRPAQK